MYVYILTPCSTPGAWPRMVAGYRSMRPIKTTRANLVPCTILLSSGSSPRDRLAALTDLISTLQLTGSIMRAYLRITQSMGAAKWKSFLPWSWTCQACAKATFPSGGPRPILAPQLHKRWGMLIVLPNGWGKRLHTLTYFLIATATACRIYCA